MLEKGRDPGDSLLKLFDLLEASQNSAKPKQYAPSPQDPASKKVPGALRMVPTINWQHAGEAVAYEEMSRHWNGDIATSCMDRKAFGLVIDGDSMVPNCQPQDVCILMPSEEPRNGCLVAAKLHDDGVVLRRFTRMADGRVRLIAYNTLYPPLEYAPSAFDWLWPVHSTMRREW
jgi:SOS-response transcriptional repressor LexA